MVKPTAPQVEITGAPGPELEAHDPVTRAALRGIANGDAPPSKLGKLVDWGKGRVKWLMNLSTQKKIIAGCILLAILIPVGIYVWEKLQPIIALINWEREKTLLILAGMGQEFLVWANS